MFNITTIVTVRNESSSDIDFQKVDESSKNKRVPADKSRRVDANVPWADKEEDFDEHHIEIQRGSEVAFFIWQSGNLVRSSRTGWQNPAPVISGDHDVNREKELVVEVGNDGELRVEMSNLQ